MFARVTEHVQKLAYFCFFTTTSLAKLLVLQLLSLLLKLRAVAVYTTAFALAAGQQLGIIAAPEVRYRGAVAAATAAVCCCCLLLVRKPVWKNPCYFFVIHQLAPFNDTNFQTHLKDGQTIFI